MTHQLLAITPSPEIPSTGIAREQEIAGALKAVLADSYLLMIKTQGYHWNVVGPMFLPIHQLTEEHYRDLFEAVDVLAERIRALGGIAPSSFAEFQAVSALAEETLNRTAADMVKQLIADHQLVVQRLRETAKLAADNDDGATEDLMNNRMAFHEKARWMLSATIAE